jgi:hypothetical protein
LLAKCGAIPLTRAPLSEEIRREVPVGSAFHAVAGEEKEDGVIQVKSFETMNRFYCAILNANGFDGD